MSIASLVAQILNAPEEKKRRVISTMCPKCRINERTKTKQGDYRAYCTPCFRNLYFERKNKCN